jgi:hypothetical protein
VAKEPGPVTVVLRDSDLVELPRGREAETIPETAEARARRGVAPLSAGSAAGPPPIALDNNAGAVAAPPRAQARATAGSVREVALDEDVAPLELDRATPAAPAPRGSSTGRGRLVGALVALAVVIAVGAGGFVVMRGRGAGAGGEVPGRVRVDVVDLPRGGKVIVDGVAQPLPSFELAGGRAPLRVRIEAPHHATRLLHLVPDRNQTLDGKLDRSR